MTGEPASGRLMIQARSLTKYYGATKALSDLSFQVNRGEILGFLGPNGAGKTTTMRILTGYLRPNTGSVSIHGVDVAKEPLKAKRFIGYLPENAPLYDDMMVIAFMKYTARLREVSKDRQNERIEATCERCGLKDVLGKDIRHLSKGYRQRVGLAQAMLHDPQLLILDEPTSGLDPNQIVEIRELIKDIGREKTVILSTHILPEVEATCNRIIIINEGNLVADDTKETLAQRKTGTLIRVVLKDQNGNQPQPDAICSTFSNLPGVRSVEPFEGEGPGTIGIKLRTNGDQDPREAIFCTAVSNNLVLLDLHREQISLEETFRKLTLGKGDEND